MRVAKEIAAWVRHAKSLGWSIEQTKQGHLRFKSSAGKMAHIPSRCASRSTMANAKGELRKAGLVFPEDEERKEALRRRGVDGLVRIHEAERVPAIVRTGAKIPDYIDDEIIRGFAKGKPSALITLDTIVESMDYDEELSGEEDEIDVVPVKPEETTMNQSSTVPTTKSDSTNGRQKDERQMLIKFGRLCEQLNDLGVSKKNVLELLEHAALLELSAAEVLEAAK